MENGQDITFAERRRYPRVLTNVPIKYKNLRTVGVIGNGSLTKDLGEGGVRFKTNEFISLACRLVLELSLPTVPKPIKAISKVAWIRKSAANDYYEVGNQFLEITKEDKAYITDFVKNVLKANL